MPVCLVDPHRLTRALSAWWCCPGSRWELRLGSQPLRRAVRYARAWNKRCNCKLALWKLICRNFEHLILHAASEGVFKEELELELPCISANFWEPSRIFVLRGPVLWFILLKRVSFVESVCNRVFHCECAVFEMDERFFSHKITVL